eukprot:750776-Hanusia_phi.AAC.2
MLAPQTCAKLTSRTRLLLRRTYTACDDSREEGRTLSAIEGCRVFLSEASTGEVRNPRKRWQPTRSDISDCRRRFDLDFLPGLDSPWKSDCSANRVAKHRHSEIPSPRLST